MSSRDAYRLSFIRFRAACNAMDATLAAVDTSTFVPALQYKANNVHPHAAAADNWTAHELSRN